MNCPYARQQNIFATFHTCLSNGDSLLVLNKIYFRHSPAKELYYPDKDLNSPVKGSSYPDKDPSYPDKKPSYPDKKPSYPDKEPSYPDKHSEYTRLAAKLEAILASLGFSSMPKRVAPDKMEIIITALCEGDWLTGITLSRLLDREIKSLQDQYLAQMVASGFLCLKYPDKKNHPDQAYRTAHV